MTPQEALYWCEQFTDNIVLVDPQREKMVLALQAMRECKKALEKQIPKKTLWGGTNNASWRSCPECHSRENKTHKYCSQCGQALDWSDTE